MLKKIEGYVTILLCGIVDGCMHKMYFDFSLFCLFAHCLTHKKQQQSKPLKRDTIYVSMINIIMFFYWYKNVFFDFSSLWILSRKFFQRFDEYASSVDVVWRKPCANLFNFFYIFFICWSKIFFFIFCMCIVNKERLSF